MNSVAEIQISKAAVLHNLQALKGLCPATSKFAAVLKGNAYGHGLTEVYKCCRDQVDAIQLDDLDELLALRHLEKELGISPKRSLVLGYVPRAGLQDLVAAAGEIALYDGQRAVLLQDICSRINTTVRVHLKIDALLGRQGVLPDRFAELFDLVSKLPNLEIAGIYTHFANIEDSPDSAHALAQITAFQGAVSGYEGPTHIAATSGIMVEEGRAGNHSLVRVGIGVYGIYPSFALSRTQSHLALQPVLKWVSQLAMVKDLPAGHPVGYGLTYVTRKPTRIGIVPQGYADGFDRGLSNTGQVLIKGKRCPVIGRVAMNMFAVDLEAVPNSLPEDEVVLLGSQGDDRITAEEVASLIGTIPYEVVTRISPLLQRRIV